MEKKFTTGNVVRLKSGGPKMTVKEYEWIYPFGEDSYQSESSVVCVWFDEKSNTRQESFEQDMLVLD